MALYFFSATARMSSPVFEWLLNARASYTVLIDTWKSLAKAFLLSIDIFIIFRFFVLFILFIFVDYQTFVTRYGCVTFAKVHKNIYFANLE